VGQGRGLLHRAWTTAQQSWNPGRGGIIYGLDELNRAGGGRRGAAPLRLAQTRGEALARPADNYSLLERKMSLSLYDLTLPTFLQTVKAVQRFLDRGSDLFAAAGIDADDFVNTRFFADMAPFHLQIEAAWHHCDGDGRIGNGSVQPAGARRTGSVCRDQADEGQGRGRPAGV